MSETPTEAFDPATRGSVELLLYDYFKHMTSLALITLGGILSIPQVSGISIAMRDLLPSIALIVLSGASSLHATEAVIKAKLVNRPLPAGHKWHRIVASSTFGLGIGAFLSVIF